MPRSALLALCLSIAACSAPPRDVDWAVYGAHAGGDRYSQLDQIDRSNVTRLELAWRYDMAESGDSQTNPLVIAGTLYGFTPALKVIALDAATGKERWQFDPKLRGSALGGGRYFTGPARGLALWRDGRETRLFAGVMNYSRSIQGPVNRSRPSATAAR